MIIVFKDLLEKQLNNLRLDLRMAIKIGNVCEID